MNITINHHFSAEPQLLSLLDKLVTGLNNVATENAAAATGHKSVNGNGKLPAVNETATTDKPAKPAVQQEGAELLTIEDIRTVVSSKTKGNEANRNKVKALLTEFGVAKTTELKQDQYQPFYDKVYAL